MSRETDPTLRTVHGVLCGYGMHSGPAWRLLLGLYDAAYEAGVRAGELAACEALEDAMNDIADMQRRMPAQADLLARTKRLLGDR